MEVIDDIPYLRTGSQLCQPQRAGGNARVPTPLVIAMPAEGVIDSSAEVPPPPASAREADGGEGVPPPTSAREADGGGEAPSPAPAREVDGDEVEAWRDFKKEAASTQHLLTHKPFNKYCEGCKAAKMKDNQHFVGPFKREVKRWGENITADHPYPDVL